MKKLIYSAMFFGLMIVSCSKSTTLSTPVVKVDSMAIVDVGTISKTDKYPTPFTSSSQITLVITFDRALTAEEQNSLSVWYNQNIGTTLTGTSWNSANNVVTLVYSANKPYPVAMGTSVTIIVSGTNINSANFYFVITA